MMEMKMVKVIVVVDDEVNGEVEIMLRKIMGGVVRPYMGKSRK